MHDWLPTISSPIPIWWIWHTVLPYPWPTSHLEIRHNNLHPIMVYLTWWLTNPMWTRHTYVGLTFYNWISIQYIPKNAKVHEDLVEVQAEESLQGGKIPRANLAIITCLHVIYVWGMVTCNLSWILFYFWTMVILGGSKTLSPSAYSGDSLG